MQFQAQIAQLIGQLLEDYPCVIWPGFGGFLSHERPSLLLESQGLIYPPGKSISFNKRLSSNDGLLAKHWAESNQCSFSDAVLQLESEAKSWFAVLRESKTLKLGELGVFQLKQENIIAFEPSAKVWLSDTAFGLPVISLPPVLTKKETIEKPAAIVVPFVQEEKAKEQPAISIAPPIEKSNKRRWWAAAIWIPVALGAGYLLHAGMDTYKTNGNLASLNPFPQHECIADYAPRFEEEKFKLEWMIGSALKGYMAANPKADTFRFDFEKGIGSEDGVLIVKKAPSLEQAEPIADSKVNVTLSDRTAPKFVESKSRLGLHFIVAGAFREKSNANKLVTKLQSKGFDAVIFSNDRGLHHVSYGSYTNRDSAKTALQSIKAQENPQAWIKSK